jgi:hypothetical protein
MTVLIIHCKDLSKDLLTLMLNINKTYKLWAEPNLLLLLLQGEKFWHPSYRLLGEAKILVEHGIDGAYGGASVTLEKWVIFTAP